MRTLLMHLEGAQRFRFWFITVFRSFIGVIDLAALGLLWYTASGIVSGKFASVEILGVPFLTEQSLSEQNVVAYGALVLGLFILKGLLGVASLKALGNLAVEVEVALANGVLGASLRPSKAFRFSEKADVASSQHAIDSAAAWARGGVLGYSVVIAEIFLVCTLFIAMVFVNPLMGLGLFALLGSAAAILNRALSIHVRSAAENLRESNSKVKSELASAISVRPQINLLGLLDGWISGILERQRAAAEANASVYLFTSLPRYLMEIAVLISVAAIIGGSFLLGEFADNAPGAAVVLAAAFRISAALLPLQNAIYLVAHAKELSKDLYPFLQAGQFPLEQGVALVQELEKQILEFKNQSKSKALIILGKSGLGKTTALHQAIHNLVATGDLVLGEFGVATQDSKLIAGGLKRNVYLDYLADQSDAATDWKSLADELEMDAVFERLASTEANDIPNLSGGELTRFQFIRANLGSPQLVFLDEPTTGLDGQLIVKMAEMINALDPRYVIVSHDRKFSSLIRDVRTLSLDNLT